MPRSAAWPRHLRRLRGCVRQADRLRSGAGLLGQNYEFDDLTNDEAKLDALFLKEYINGIVEEMPEKCRMVFRCSREIGMKNKEIADKFQITEKGVEANLTRALKIIRAELKNNLWVMVFPLCILYYIFR